MCIRLICGIWLACTPYFNGCQYIEAFGMGEARSLVIISRQKALKDG